MTAITALFAAFPRASGENDHPGAPRNPGQAPSHPGDPTNPGAPSRHPGDGRPINPPRNPPGAQYAA